MCHIFDIFFCKMKLKEKRIIQESYISTNYFRNSYPGSKEEIAQVLDLTEQSARVLKMQKLISEMWNQNPNFSVDDIEKIMLRNKIHPELIRLVIWKKDNKIDENYNIDKLMDDLIIQNPDLTKEVIKDRMNTVELYYKWKNRNLF